MLPVLKPKTPTQNPLHLVYVVPGERPQRLHLLKERAPLLHLVRNGVKHALQLLALSARLAGRAAVPRRLCTVLGRRVRHATTETHQLRQPRLLLLIQQRT